MNAHFHVFSFTVKNNRLDVSRSYLLEKKSVEKLGWKTDHRIGIEVKVTSNTSNLHPKIEKNIYTFEIPSKGFIESQTDDTEKNALIEFSKSQQESFKTRLMSILTRFNQEINTLPLSLDMIPLDTDIQNEMKMNATNQATI